MTESSGRRSDAGVARYCGPPTGMLCGYLLPVYELGLPVRPEGTHYAAGLHAARRKGR
jgi:hypothetical protein